MAFVKVRVPRTSQPQDGGIGVEDLLGYPVFTILGNSITDSNGLTGSLVGTAKLSPNRYGIGVDSTVTAGDRLSFSYFPGRDLSADVPTTILLQFENNVWATGGLTNYIAGQSDSSSSTGHYEFSLADNVLSLTYRRNSGSDVTVTFGTLPAGIVTILLCRESSGTNGWRSYVNGVDFGYGNSNGYATSPFQGGGTNAFSIGSTASLGTRGLKGNFLLFHAATGKVIPASLGVDVTQSPASAWQVFKPEERLIWIPDAVSAGGATVIPIGQQATGSVGSPTATGAATTAATGVSAASAVGTPTAIAGASIPATVTPAGVIAYASIGSLIATGAAWTMPGGVQATSVVGTPTAIAGTSLPATALPAGVSAMASVGTPSANGASISYAGGVSAFTAVSAPTAIGGVSGQATALPAGVRAISYVGMPTATAAAVVYASGVQAIGYVGMPIALGDPVAYAPSIYQAYLAVPKNQAYLAVPKNQASIAIPKNQG